MGEITQKENYRNVVSNSHPYGWLNLEFGKFVKKAKKKSNLQIGDKCIELEHINQVVGSINGFDESGLLSSTKNVFKKGDVLFGKLRPYLRKYWIASFDGFCSSEIWVLNGINEVCSNQYLFFFLQTHKFIQVANVTSGSKMPRADWAFISNFPFSLPPLPEQKKIADILSTWDKAIETTQTLIVKLQLRKKGLMQQLLIGKKRLPGFHGEWEFMSLEKMLSIKAEKFNPKESENIKCIELEHIDQETGRINGFTNSEEQKSTKNKFKTGQVLYGKLRPYLRKYWQAEFDGVCSTEIWVLNIKNKLLVDEFLLYVVQGAKFNNLANATSGSKMPRADWNYMKEFEFKTPSIKEQTAIAQVLTKADEEIDQTQQYLEQLQAQKKGLMQQLLTGQKRVSV